MANNYYSLQYTGNKVIQWKNFTDTSTPLSAANLQKSHQAIDDMDQAINAGFQSVDNTKLDKTLAGSMLTGVTYNDETGQMVFHHYDNAIPDTTFNTNLQKLVVNFRYDSTTQKLMLTQADGTVVPVDLSAFVANPDLQNSDTIAWTINQDGSISASVRNGSITDAMIQSGYLAQVTAKASAAAASATNADYYSKLAKSYANGTSNLQDRPNENVDNSKYFKQESEAWAVGTKDGTAVPSTASQYHNNSKYWAEQAAQSSGVVDMKGATATTAGAHGLVPAPGAGDNTKFLRGDGSWQEASASDFTGATSSSDGAHGLVPAPLIADKDKFLKGDGSWGDVDLSAFTGATSSSDGTKGMVPKPLSTDREKFLKGDGSWGEVDLSAFTGATSSTAGAKGMVPAPAIGDQEKVLRGDGTWGTINMSPFTGATANDDGTSGQVPQPLAGDQNKFLTGGGIWTPDTANLTTTYTTEDDDTTTAIITSAGGETAISTMESGAKHSRLFNKISRVALNTRKLINTVKRIWNSVANTWASGAEYKAGNVVTYINGHTYICILDHTSSSSITPLNTTYWEDKTLGDMIASLNTNYANMLKFKRFSRTVTFQGYYIGDIDITENGYTPIAVAGFDEGYVYYFFDGILINGNQLHYAIGSHMSGNIGAPHSIDILYRKN